MIVRVAAFLLLIAASGCAANPAGPWRQGPLRLTATIDKIQLAPGATAVATFRLENTGSTAVTLDFSSSCQVMPFIALRPSNQIVHPAGGGWACATVLTQLTLAPNSAHDVQLQVIGRDARPGLVTLPPGDYAFFARVESTQHALQSAPVSLSVL